MIAVRPFVASLGAGLLLSLGVLAPGSSVAIAVAAPILAQTHGQPASKIGGPSFPNPHSANECDQFGCIDATPGGLGGVEQFVSRR
jgi:hypothetical protein